MLNDPSFTSSVSAQKITVIKRGKSLWEFWDKDKQEAFAIEKNNLKCKITGVSDAVYTRENENPKRKLHINVTSLAGKRYYIESGFNTWFSKTMLVSLDLIPLDGLNQACAIAVRGGQQTSSQTVFGSIFDASGIAYSTKGTEWRDLDYETIFERVKQKFASVEIEEIPEIDSFETAIDEDLMSAVKEADSVINTAKNRPITKVGSNYGEQENLFDTGEKLDDIPF